MTFDEKNVDQNLETESKVWMRDNQQAMDIET